MSETCECCCWWAFVAHDEASMVGECRRRAPIASGIAGQERPDTPLWPITKGQDWCGDHVAEVSQVGARDWRDTPVSSIDWTRFAGTVQIANHLALACSQNHNGEWAALTVGQLSDMGERGWNHLIGIGPAACSAIHAMITHMSAAERRERER